MRLRMERRPCPSRSGRDDWQEVQPSRVKPVLRNPNLVAPRFRRRDTDTYSLPQVLEVILFEEAHRPEQPFVPGPVLSLGPLFLPQALCLAKTPSALKLNGLHAPNRTASPGLQHR